MLHHGWKRHPIRIGQDGYRRPAAAQVGQNRAPRGIRQGAKDGVQPPVILNHMVYYYS